MLGPDYVPLILTATTKQLQLMLLVCFAYRCCCCDAAVALRPCMHQMKCSMMQRVLRHQLVQRW
jgi:hypothetical protein